MSGGKARRAVLGAVILILLWCVMELAFRRPAIITDDWHGWRQADTHAIARNLARLEPNPLRPRIDWGGAGPGYVEAELALYPALIAVGISTIGDHVLVGQGLSLLLVAAAGWLVFCGLTRRFGEVPALAGLLALLSTRGVVTIGTSIQPDTLAFVAFVAGFFAFLRYLDKPTWPWLLAWVSATAIAALVKPTTLELGIFQFVVVALRSRQLLRRPQLWLGWGVVLCVVTAYLLHGRALYLQYGNTFGVLSGGDSKLARLDRLMEPWRWIDLARYEVNWGVGWPAVLAAGYLAARRRLQAEEYALGLAALALCVLAFRYTSHTFGTHYHLPHALLGAWLVAHASREWLTHIQLRHAGAALMAAMAATAAVLLAGHLSMLRGLPVEHMSRLGQELSSQVAPGTLGIVRSGAVGFDEDWHTVNNYQDPRVFYLSRTRGWVLPSDAPGASGVAEGAALGAQFYVHVATVPIDAELLAWLTRHAELTHESPAGAIFRINPMPGAMPHGPAP